MHAVVYDWLFAAFQNCILRQTVDGTEKKEMFYLTMNRTLVYVSDFRQCSWLSEYYGITMSVKRKKERNVLFNDIYLQYFTRFVISLTEFWLWAVVCR